MRSARGAIVLMAVLLACRAGEAAEQRSSSTPQIQKFEEVERGFWLRSTFGVAVHVTDAFESTDRESSIWPPGALLGLELGFDLGQYASLHLAVYGHQVPGSKDTGRGRASVANDAGALLIMGGGRFNLMTTKRTGWFIKANVGYLLGIPAEASMENSLAFQATTGLEYATNLRHFTIGLEAGASFFLTGSGLSILLTPTVKYTF